MIHLRTLLHRSLTVFTILCCAMLMSLNAADIPNTVKPDKSKYDSEKGKAPLEVTLKRILEAKTGCQLIFIGDSITAGWAGGNGKEVWESHFAKYQPLNFGIGGDRTQHVLWRLENPDLAEVHPKAAVILIGTNNRTDAPADIALGVQAVVKKTQAVFPGIKIVLMSIMPNQRAQDVMMTANETIKTFADGTDVLYYDIVALMPKEGDNWKGLSQDKLHLSKDGYAIWAEGLKPFLEKLLPQ